MSRVDEKIDNRLACIRRRICVLYSEGCENHPSLLRLMDFLFATFKSICFDHIPIKFSFIFCNKIAAGKILNWVEKSKQVFFISYEYMSRIFIFPLTLSKKQEEEGNLSGKLVKNKLTSRKGDERWKEDDEKWKNYCYWHWYSRLLLSFQF